MKPKDNLKEKIFSLVRNWPSRAQNKLNILPNVLRIGESDEEENKSRFCASKNVNHLHHQRFRRPVHDAYEVSSRSRFRKWRFII